MRRYLPTREAGKAEDEESNNYLYSQNWIIYFLEFPKQIFGTIINKYFGIQNCPNSIEKQIIKNLSVKLLKNTFWYFLNIGMKYE
jgi:hypothetical protein